MVYILVDAAQDILVAIVKITSMIVTQTPADMAPVLMSKMVTTVDATADILGKTAV